MFLFSFVRGIPFDPWWCRRRRRRRTRRPAARAACPCNRAFAAWRAYRVRPAPGHCRTCGGGVSPWACPKTHLFVVFVLFFCIRLLVLNIWYIVKFLLCVYALSMSLYGSDLSLSLSLSLPLERTHAHTPLPSFLPLSLSLSPHTHNTTHILTHYTHTTPHTTYTLSHTILYIYTHTIAYLPHTTTYPPHTHTTHIHMYHTPTATRTYAH